MSITIGNLLGAADSNEETVATIDTPLGSSVRLHAMGGIEELSRPFVYEVDVVSNRSDIAPSELLGQSVTVHLSVGDDDGDVRHWNGRVTGFQYIDTSDDGDSRYRLTLRPWLWQLTRSADCRIFQQMSIPEIVVKVFQDRGFSDFDRTLFEDYPLRDYVVQYRETDFQFVTRLLEREGIYYFFRHENGKHTLVLADSPQAHQPSAGCEKVPFAPEDEHRDATTQYVQRWKAEVQLETGVYAHSDYDFTKPQVQLFGQASATDGASTGLHVYDYPGGFDNFADADAYARLRLEQSRRDAQRWSGETNARGMTVGATFKLTDHPRDDQNASYLVTWARYRIKGQDQRSTGDDEDPYTCSFVAINADVTFRPPVTSSKPVIRGPQTAVVVGPSGQEIWTDQYGRVKVQFPWDRLGANDENSSCWIRVVQTWAGGSFGAQFIPRIGHEVLVDFIEGDPDRPIITGSVYNGSNMPTFSLPTNQTQSGLRSRSTPNGWMDDGNEIRFEDMAGAEDLYVHAQRTQTTVVESDQSVTIGGNRRVFIDGNAQLQVGMGRTTSVAGGDAVTIAGSSSVAVTGNQTTTVAGPFSAQFAAGATVAVVGAEVVTVAGTASRQVAAGQTTTITGNDTDSISGSRTVSVGADDVLSVAATRAVTVGAGGQDTAQDKAFVWGTYGVGAKSTVTIESQKEIVLRCGTTELRLTPKSLVVNAESVHVVASKEVQLAGNGPSLQLADDAQLMAKKITAVSSGAQLSLSDGAKLMGSKVQLGSGSGSDASPPSSQTDSTKSVAFTFLDSQESPLANKTYLLEVAGQTTKGTTDGNGGITATPPPDATDGTCTVWSGDFPDGPRVTYRIVFGPMDPPSSIKGAQQRLKNLSYYGGKITGQMNNGTRDALLTFQRVHGLKPTGRLDGDTIAKLSDIHP